jgi:hypothetical protein
METGTCNAFIAGGYLCDGDEPCIAIGDISKHEPIQCHACRRKWETPAQYKERTGAELRDDAPVYVLIDNAPAFVDGIDDNGARWGKVETLPARWCVHTYFSAKLISKHHPVFIVVATADWGKPPADWRPE